MLFEIAQNSTIQRFQKMLMPIFDYVYSGLRVKHNGVEHNGVEHNGVDVKSEIKNPKYASHRMLLNVLENGTAEEFRSKMREHLFMYFDKV